MKITNSPKFKHILPESQPASTLNLVNLSQPLSTTTAYTINTGTTSTTSTTMGSSSSKLNVESKIHFLKTIYLVGNWLLTYGRG
ncbi:hypothetical protein L873DRAFT_1813090 [Choiromyces venosus 120613-1]|uniref:Uncharacterized protein n=1 Tax=Choiromyces venosus 120613-1 TaxID=1336337 RepID=A0A3N4JAX2_9PEZI|nr:hypothetical protein L873DRAFT_1813090 [Choiromyces venosus 120613-1]